MRIVLAALTLTGCLFAPPRPSNEGDGGVPDGNVDADLAACTPSPSAVLDVVAAVPKPSSNLDILVRAGTDHGTAHVYLYDAGPDPLRQCADAVIALTLPEAGVSRVLALAPGRAGYLVVLAESTGGTPLWVFEIDLQTFTVAAERLELSVTLGTVDGEPSPFVAYAADAEKKQIWLGGPGLTSIDVTAGFGNPGGVISAVPSPDYDDKLLFAVSTDDSQVPVELVGQLKTYGAELENGGSVVVAAGVVRDATHCSEMPPNCEVQLVRPVFGGPARNAFFSHVVLRPASGRVAVRAVGADSYMLFETPPPAFDVALDDFNGSNAVDVVTLNGSPQRRISVLQDPALGGTPTRFNQPVMETVQRVLVGKFTTGVKRQILGLSVSPAGVGVVESCIESNVGGFVSCGGR